MVCRLQIPLDRQAGPLYRQITAFVEDQILVGNLPPGSMLPPIRTLADRLGVSKNVVAMAYAELEAAGRVAGRVGQGTTVIAPPPVAQRREEPVVEPQRAPNGAVLHDLMRLQWRPGMINLTTLSPSPEHLPMDSFGKCLRAVMHHDGPAAYAYDKPEGYGPLRQAIARHLVDRGMRATPDEVMVTAGAQQAMDITIRGLVAPGEWVVMETPCFVSAMEVCAHHNVRMAMAPMDEGGLVLEKVEELFRMLRPRLLYTNPTYQNPTGTVLSLERRRRLVELAARYNVAILEDAVCSELELAGATPPALQALDRSVSTAGPSPKRCCQAFAWATSRRRHP